jgi:hypothetical protein
MHSHCSGLSPNSFTGCKGFGCCTTNSTQMRRVQRWPEGALTNRSLGVFTDKQVPFVKLCTYQGQRISPAESVITLLLSAVLSSPLPPRPSSPSPSKLCVISARRSSTPRVQPQHAQRASLSDLIYLYTLNAQHASLFLTCERSQDKWKAQRKRTGPPSAQAQNFNDRTRHSSEQPPQSMLQILQPLQQHSSPTASESEAARNHYNGHMKVRGCTHRRLHDCAHNGKLKNVRTYCIRACGMCRDGQIYAHTHIYVFMYGVYVCIQCMSSIFSR